MMSQTVLRRAGLIGTAFPSTGWRSCSSVPRHLKHIRLHASRARLGDCFEMSNNKQGNEPCDGPVFRRAPSLWQVMPDIPYGDCFTVEARWNVTNAQPLPDGTPRVAIATHVMVNFGAGLVKYSTHMLTFSPFLVSECLHRTMYLQGMFRLQEVRDS